MLFLEPVFQSSGRPRGNAREQLGAGRSAESQAERADTGNAAGGARALGGQVGRPPGRQGDLQTEEKMCRENSLFSQHGFRRPRERRASRIRGRPWRLVAGLQRPRRAARRPSPTGGTGRSQEPGAAQSTFWELGRAGRGKESQGLASKYPRPGPRVAESRQMGTGRTGDSPCCSPQLLTESPGDSEAGRGLCDHLETPPWEQTGGQVCNSKTDSQDSAKDTGAALLGSSRLLVSESDLTTASRRIHLNRKAYHGFLTLFRFQLLLIGLGCS